MGKGCNVDGCNEKHLAKGKCRYHYRMPSQMPKVSDIEEPKTKKGKSIPIMSESYRKRLAEYRKKRDEYFKKEPVCEFPCCTSRDITLHHMKGRIGKDLVDEKNFKSLCFPHHRFVEENPAEAIKLGLSKSRLGR